MENASEEGVQSIDIQGAYLLVEENKVNIVDVRNQEAFDEGHIKDAMLVTEENIEDFIKNADKQKPLLCYCFKGFSSRDAASHFKQQGFETVYTMDGGIEEWGGIYPVEGSSD